MALTPQELKKALIAAGFEVYRTIGEEVILADRARENLILDSGVRVRASEPIQVRLVMGVRHAQFPGDDEQGLFDRVRELAAPLLADGFNEQSTRVAPVEDPSERGTTLDTFYEVVFVKEESSFDVALPTLKLALTIAKTAESRH